MFMLPNLPSAKAGRHELADFVELLAWSNGAVSAREVISYLRQVGENSFHVGCDDDDDKYAAKLDEVMDECERRSSACGIGYPFKLGFEGSVLTYLANDNDHRSNVYRYLLLCTRLNMQEKKVHSKLDGTHLFEEVSAHVLRCYLGKMRASSIVFGTSVMGNFESKVDKLCKDLREGIRFRKKHTAPVVANDDKLDAVAWIPFSDGYQSQLIIFGQCKTGTSWRGTVTQLVPETFIDLWMHDSFFLKPLRAFCVAESTDRATWATESMYAGLLFDRCRLVDFCEELNAELFKKVRTWTESAYATLDLSARSLSRRAPKRSRVSGRMLRTAPKKQRTRT